tara:strand:+ start:300 stop:698 length:399 start_codon:yes stop_codon:yes gene_type:complete
MVNILPASLMTQLRMNQKGLLGTAVATGILEFGTQALEKYLPEVRKVTDTTIINSAPFLGNVDVRDAIVLSPTIKEVSKFAGKGKPNFKNILVNYGMKVILRNAGLNPLPDVHTDKTALKIKQYSQQLPARM